MTYYGEIEQLRQMPNNERHLYYNSTIEQIEQRLKNNNQMPQSYKDWYFDNCKKVIEYQIKCIEYGVIICLRNTNHWIIQQMLKIGL